MKHIRKTPADGWSLTQYFDYLDLNREILPREVYEFASNREHYSLTSHRSLHDAWLEWLVVSESASGNRSEIRCVQIECRFLSPYHNQYIELKYVGVCGYVLKAIDPLLGNSAVGHGDLLMHEVRLEGGRVVHEMLFSNGGSVEIWCQTFSHRIVLRS